MSNKKDVFHVWVDLHKSDIVTLSETWLNSSISEKA